MNLIEESFQNKEEKKKKRTTRIILVAMILVFMTIIVIVTYLMYAKSKVMTLTIDGQANEKLKNLLVIESDGTIYAPIKEIAQYFGYDSFNGEYSEKSEQQSKCYVQNENEIANFELGQNKIYKLDLTENNADYEYSYIKNPVKAINGVLYTSAEGLQKAFNISFDYDQDKNRITIFTLPYLYQYYASQVLDYGYVELNNVFANQKAILKNQLIVLKDKDKKQMGVIGVDGKAILEPKYDNITFLPNIGDFLVENNSKVGILSASGETKVQIMYDSIELMDSDAGLYVAKKDNKYGVIDIRGNIKIYIENDEIGVDISKFAQNGIKNKYILVDNLIPVRKDKYWGLYDKNGNQVAEFKYDSLGYVVSNNKDAMNLLVIPNYKVLVACKDKKYTLINASGSELFATVADDIYMTISGGEKHYYITINDQKIDAEQWMDANGITASSAGTNKNQNQNQNEKPNNDSNLQNEDNNDEDNDNQEQNDNDENSDNNSNEDDENYDDENYDDENYGDEDFDDEDDDESYDDDMGA